MTMREKIARAICKAHYEREYGLTGITESVIARDLYIDKRWKDFESQADAVLDALMEPDEEMIEAGDRWQDHSADTATMFSEMIKVAIHGRD